MDQNYTNKLDYLFYNFIKIFLTSMPEIKKYARVKKLKKSHTQKSQLGTALEIRSNLDLGF